MLRSRRRRAETELELRSAQEVQLILVPEVMPAIPGFVLASAYRPAQEVGRDFFQVISLWDESTLVLIGDVSGKGLRVGMMVALIIGAVRTGAESDPDPAAVLGSVNRRLSGRMRGGFATSLAVRVYPDGRCTVANAGHLAPVLNGEEMETPGALPLGLDQDATYDAMPIRLKDGTRLRSIPTAFRKLATSEGNCLAFIARLCLSRTRKGLKRLRSRRRYLGRRTILLC